LQQYSSIRHFHTALKEGSATCVHAVQHYLDAIDASRHLNTFLEVFKEEALKRAAELDKSPVSGKLHGVVIGLKDNICYKDHASTASSRILLNYRSIYSATAVQRLIDEGAIIIGRQNCDEFGMGSTNENSAYGPVLNPNNTGYVPGGSSGGSAASVKAGLCMAALGSDTGGSIRLPADFCGVVGLKPSYGRVSRYGLIAYGSSFDQIGVLAKTIEDASIILEVINGDDDFDSTAYHESFISPQFTESEKKYRIAYFPEWLNHTSVDEEIRNQILDLINSLKENGHTVEEIHFDYTDYIVPCYYVLTTAEASSNLSRFDGVRYGYKTGTAAADLKTFYQKTRSEGFGKEVKRRILLGSFVLSAGYFDAYFTKAQQVRRQLQSQTDLIFNDFDFIIAPNSPTTAYPFNEKIEDPVAMYMGDIFTVFANLTGIPAISLPLFKHSSNLPFGLQVMANRYNEVSLLRFSHQLMQQ
jgi:aspartyl-tRNA(Asn)/glutamyl-tRNA(Gln) amidotransferase subunit A